MKHILPLVAAALAAGLAVREPLLAAAVLVPAVLAPRLRALRVPALAFLAGSLLPATPQSGGLHRGLPDGAPLVRVEGTAATGPDLPVHGRQQFDLLVRRVGGRAVGGRVRVLAPADAPAPSPGSLVAATGRLRTPRPAENPGERGPREALADRGISHLLLLSSGPSLEILAPPAWGSPRALVHRARRTLDAALTRVAPDASGLVRGLLLGRRDLLPERVEDDFRRSGTSHFLAISGLHVGLLAGLLWLAFRVLPVPRPAAAVLVAAFSLLYAAITGLRPPAVRAALFVLLYAGGVVLRRPVRVLNLLALAAIALLLFDPGSLTRAGFQLSFAAVLAIVHLVKPLSEGLFGRFRLVDRFSVPRARPWPIRVLRRYVMSAVPVSLAAWLGTAPLAILRFGTVSSLVLPANLIVFPFVALLIPAGLLAVAGVTLPAELLARGLLATVATLASVPGAAVTVPPPPLVLVVLFYGGLFALGFRSSLGPRAVALALAGLALLAASGPLGRRPPATTRVTVLSVGHGLCAVVETPANGVLVYDAGSTRPDLFRRVLLPWLRHRGISAIDVLVVSHDDLDHRSAVGALLRNLPVRRVIGPGDARAGDRPVLAGAIVTVLAPAPDDPAGDNDGSTVVLVRSGSFRVLLTGDIEEAGIARLLAAPAAVAADVLVLPHHGRPTPAAAALARAVGARVPIASEGPLDPLDPVWSDAIRTSERGAVTVTADGGLSTFR